MKSAGAFLLAIVPPLAGGRRARWPRDKRRAHADLGFSVADQLWTEACGKQRWAGTSTTSEANSAGFPTKKSGLSRLQPEIPSSLCPRRCGPAGGRPGRYDLRRSPYPGPPGSRQCLTLGFARRFATYKRPNLLLHDPERLIRILRNPQRPAQLDLRRKGPSGRSGGTGTHSRMDAFHRRAT